MMDMDQKAIIPFLGFKGRLNDYYDETQVAGCLHKIKVPTLFINA